jgi:hypothetical protein
LQACDDKSLEVCKFAATDDDDDARQPWLEEAAITACAILLSTPPPQKRLARVQSCTERRFLFTSKRFQKT